MIRSLCNHGRADHYSYAHVWFGTRAWAAYRRRSSSACWTSSPRDPRRRASQGRRRFTEKLLSSEKKVRVCTVAAGIVENGYLNVLTVEGKRAKRSSTHSRPPASVRRVRIRSRVSAQPPAEAAGRDAHGDLALSRPWRRSVVNLPLFFGITDDRVANRPFARSSLATSADSSRRTRRTVAAKIKTVLGSASAVWERTTFAFCATLRHRPLRPVSTPRPFSR